MIIFGSQAMNLNNNRFQKFEAEKKEDIREIEVLRRGENAIEELNEELGLAFDAADLKYYTNLFKNVLQRGAVRSRPVK
jgi:hypothetical protein